ncbi:MAG: thioredoxin-related protein [Planctomycetota bacterium]|jgi:thioredoxin-related protein
MEYLVKNAVLLFFVSAISYANCALADETVDSSNYSLTYDPKRDPFSDLVLATKRAEEHERLILLIVGGSWCSWCHVLDRFLEKNEAFADLFYETFEVVKIYYGPKNENEFFLSKFPKIKGYPHFFIMDSNFDLIGDQDTGSLEQKKRYPLSSEHYQEKRMIEFLDRWAMYLKISSNKDLQPNVEFND